MKKQKKFTKAQKAKLVIYWWLRKVAEDNFYARLREIESDILKTLGIPDLEFLRNLDGEYFGIWTFGGEYEILETELDALRKRKGGR
jgi:hypothetical protein